MKDMFFNTNLNSQNKMNLVYGPQWKKNKLFKKYYLNLFKNQIPKDLVKLNEFTDYGGIFDLEFYRWKKKFNLNLHNGIGLQLWF